MKLRGDETDGEAGKCGPRGRKCGPDGEVEIRITGKRKYDLRGNGNADRTGKWKCGPRESGSTVCGEAEIRIGRESRKADHRE